MTIQSTFIISINYTEIKLLLKYWSLDILYADISEYSVHVSGIYVRYQACVIYASCFNARVYVN